MGKAPAVLYRISFVREAPAILCGNFFMRKSPAFLGIGVIPMLKVL